MNLNDPPPSYAELFGSASILPITNTTETLVQTTQIIQPLNVPTNTTETSVQTIQPSNALPLQHSQSPTSANETLTSGIQYNNLKQIR